MLGVLDGATDGNLLMALENENYEKLTLEDLDEASELAIKIVMREGALRFKEKLVEHLKSFSSASADFNFINEVENFDENEATRW